MTKKEKKDVPIWEYLVEVQIYNPYLKKFDSRIISNYFISYAINSKRYRFYFSYHISKIVEAADVNFLED